MDGSARKVTVTLGTLTAQSEEQSKGSNPYLWPAMVFVNKQTAQVSMVGIADSSAHRILKAGLKTGQTVSIPPEVGSMHRFVQEPLSQMALILTVGVFEDNETPDSAVKGGYQAFRTQLRASIASHLLALASSNPDDVELAKAEIAEEVEAAVKSAVRGALTTSQKIQVALGILDTDTSMGSGSTSFDPISSRNFTLTLGDPVKHSYTIAGTLDVKIQLCFDRQVAVNQAKAALESAENQLRNLKTQFAQASPTEKPGLRLEIEEFEQTVRDLQAQVDAAKAALQSCLDRFQHLHDVEAATDAVLVTR